jgi:hypothetical protein
MKIKEVHERYQNMMRSRDEEVKKLSLTLEEMERKLSESKFDAFAKGDFVDKLAPQGIYGKDSTTKVSPKVEKTAYGPETSVDPSSGVSANSGLTKSGPTSSMTPMSTSKFNWKSGTNSGLKHSGPIGPHNDGPPPPKMATFDGRTEWCPFKFNSTGSQTDVTGMMNNI